MCPPTDKIKEVEYLNAKPRALDLRVSEWVLRIEMCANSRNGMVQVRWLVARESDILAKWYCLARQEVGVGSVEFSGLIRQFHCFVLAAVSKFGQDFESQFDEEDPFYCPEKLQYFASSFEGLTIMAQPTTLKEVELYVLRPGRNNLYQIVGELVRKDELVKFGLKVIEELNNFYISQFPEFSHWRIPRHIDYELNFDLRLQKLSSGQSLDESLK